VFSYVLLLGQSSVPVEAPAQVTSQAGQQLFPSIAPDKTITFSQRNGTNWDIYVLRHATAPINLTADSAQDDWQQEFSPDGKWLAFRSERNGGGIYIMNPNGGNVKRLTSAGFNPTWSPDGSEIAYSSVQIVADPAFRPLPGTLNAVKVATGERRVIYAAGDAVQPRWSPNGQRLAYWGFASQGGQRDIWTIPAAGGSPIAVTNDAATDWNPVWAPDGRSLYFASDRSGKMEIWRTVIDEKTGRVQGQPEQITRDAIGTRGHIAFAFGELGLRLFFIDQTVSQRIERVGFDPAAGKVVGQPMRILDVSLAPAQLEVSPDGQALAFYSTARQENLYVAQRDGTNPRPLTNDAARDRGPAWSPDGSKIAFYSDRSGNYEIWTIKPDGTALTQLTNSPQANRSGILWSPDSFRLLYVQRSGPTWETFVIDAGKPPAQQILEELPAIGAADEYFAPTSWSPDGEKLAGNLSYTDRVEPGGIFVYSFAFRTFQKVVDRAAGARWLNDNRRLVYPDAATNTIFLVDTQAPKPVEIFSVAPRSLGPIRLSPDNESLYFSLSTAESHIWQVTIPPRS
jgi:Tol biopolymer transport system component